MAKKKEVPKHIQEFYDRGDKIEKLLRTTEAVHSEAYLKGLDAVKDSKGQVDLNQLEDTTVQDNMLDKMIDHYMTSAVRDLGLKGKPEDHFEQDLILQKYVGITRSGLRRTLRANKSKYSLKAHEGQRDKLIKAQAEEITPLQFGHLDEGHIDDILQHTGSTKYFNKDNIQRVEDVVGLLELYKAAGEIKLSDLKQLQIPKAYLTADAKKEMKELKEKYKN